MDKIELIDFDSSKKNLRFYGGMSGDKFGIEYKEEPYILKFPQNTRTFRMKHPISYSNNPYSEFIGSHFYEYMGLPAHETLLGTARGHVVVACKDFCGDSFTLIEFAKLANAVSTDTGNIQLPSTGHSDKGTVLDSIIDIISTLDVLEPIRKKLIERFWDMFVIDSIIANPDRNSGNWGVLNPIGSTSPDALMLAPVFDNGNSLNCKLGDEAIEVMSKVDMEEMSLKIASVFIRFDDKGEPHKINPYAFIRNLTNKECNKAILRLKPRIPDALDRIKILIERIPGITQARREFYIETMRIRYEKAILPASRLLTESIGENRL